jgi:seryl-tRNA synthetase
MLDIKFIKDNTDIVRQACKNKNRDVNLEELISIYETRTALRREIDDINQRRNTAQKERNIEEGQKLKGLLEEAETKFKDADKQFLALMLKVPNIPSADTPLGKDDTENKIIRQWGTKPTFTFSPREHYEVGADLGIIDTETATEVAGPRLAYLKGDLALLQFALIQHCFETLTSKEKLEEIAKQFNISLSTIKPFIPVVPPVFIKPAVQNRMARYMTPQDHYLFPEDDQMLIGSAEHTLGSMHMDEVFEEKDLPIRYVGYSTAFRREAGSYGKDTKGILRVHQFDKLEMEVFSLPETSMQEQDFLVSIQEYLLRTLDLPYQVVAVCTGDMGTPDYRQIDVETWMPGQNKYRETHSSDNMTGFQARRLGTRVKRSDGKIEPVHTNDATVFAIGRALIGIIENYQEADGRVKIPEVLRKYMFGKTHLEKLPTLA